MTPAQATPVQFYGGPWDGKRYVLKRTPPRVTLNSGQWNGVYRFNPDGVAGPQYAWTKRNGRKQK